MTVSALLRRFDDWINPIVVKELRQAVKSRMVVTILLGFLGLQLLILGFYLLRQETRATRDGIDWYAGTDVFQVQQGILLWTLSMLVPAYAAVRMGSERSDHNVDLYFISTLRPSSIIWGKFFAALTLAILIFSTCAPFMTFTYLLRGIDLPTILTVLFVDLLAMLSATMAALLMASVPGHRALKFGVAFLGFIGLAYVTVGLTVLTAFLTEVGVGWLELPDYWAMYLLGVLAVLGVIGVMYCCCVALISPPSSNRTMALRIYFSSLWLLLAAGTAWVTIKYEHIMGTRPLIVWLLLAPQLIGLLFLISISERDHWGPRITRSIPTRWWGRLTAWLFYTGSGGGVLLCLLLMTATFLLAGRLLEDNPGLRNEDAAWVALRIMTIAALYGYCYGMSAVLLRAHVFRPHIKPTMTWLLVVLLIGIGSSVPAVISYILSMDRQRPLDEVQWWMVPSPFMALYQLMPGPWRGPNEDFDTIAQWFLGIWALLITGLAMPWYAGMLRRFRPLVRYEAPLAAQIVEPAPVAEPARDVPYVTPADS